MLCTYLFVLQHESRGFLSRLYSGLSSSFRRVSPLFLHLLFAIGLSLAPKLSLQCYQPTESCIFLEVARFLGSSLVHVPLPPQAQPSWLYEGQSLSSSSFYFLGAPSSFLPPALQADRFALLPTSPVSQANRHLCIKAITSRPSSHPGKSFHLVVFYCICFEHFQCCGRLASQR